MPVTRLCAFGPYRLDFERRRLLRGTELVPIHQKALEILIVLVEHRGEMVSKDQLMQSVWPDAFVEESNLTQNIFVLRKALGEGPKENRYIATIPGRGYRFVAPVDEPRDSAKQESVETPHSKSSDNPPKTWWHSSYLRRHGILAATCALGFIFLGAILLSLPKVAKGLNNRGLYNFQKGDIKAAIEEYKWAVRISPGYATAYYNLGDTYEEIPDYDKALNEYQHAIDVDPTFYAAYNNLSRLYILRRKECDTALRLLDRAFYLHPEESAIRYTLYKNRAWANLCLDHLGQAEQNLRFAMALDPHRGSAHCLMAKLLDTGRRTSEATSEWEACLAYSNQAEVEPEWRDEAKENLGKYQPRPTGA
jgi:DNA-binding winged helix-turn-helix (wHTH) protein/Tfp pilus assembly protein PilF